MKIKLASSLTDSIDSTCGYYLTAMSCVKSARDSIEGKDGPLHKAMCEHLIELDKMHDSLCLARRVLDKRNKEIELDEF